jgi:hypothetical protein
MQSPPDGRQIYFEDPMGKIHADAVQIDYEHGDQEISPTKIVLSGHVQLLNSFSSHSEDKNSILQYAIADTVQYFPQTKEMILSATDRKRVLFYDKINNLQVSAPELKIKRDSKVKKDTIQGIGDVRFTFVGHEFEQLCERFCLDDLKKK